MSRFSAVNIARLFVSGRMIVATLMGFVSGLPLLLTGSVLQAWMKDSGAGLGTIGLVALFGLPYTLKFLWAPFLDRYQILRIGRRRGWLLLTQLAIIGSLVFLAFSQLGSVTWLTPYAQHVMVVYTKIARIFISGEYIFPDVYAVAGLAALLVAFFSASQDIVIDAYRRESLADDELGSGSGLYVSGYRVGLLLASGAGLILADFIGFEQMYLLMAAFMLVGLLTTLFAPEPKIKSDIPLTIKSAVVEPFKEYFLRPFATPILLFILLYKVGDTMAANMTIPFYLDMGYSKTEIGSIVKLLGFLSTIIGGVVGGIVWLKVGVYRGLLVFGVGQGLSTAGFAALSQFEPTLTGLAMVVAFENLTAGMGTAVFLAYMAILTDKRFTATQYALLTSLMGIPRVFIAAPTGFMATSMGWFSFFMMCALIAIPGLLLLRWMHKHDGVSESVAKKY